MEQEEAAFTRKAAFRYRAIAAIEEAPHRARKIMPIDRRAEYERVARVHLREHFIELIIGEVRAVAIHLVVDQIDLFVVVASEENFAKSGGVAVLLPTVDE